VGDFLTLVEKFGSARFQEGCATEYNAPRETMREHYATVDRTLRAVEDRWAQMERAASEARTLIDRAIGDTDPRDPDNPLLRACQILSAALDTEPSPKESP
jgi:hypothetical protein